VVVNFPPPTEPTFDRQIIREWIPDDDAEACRISEIRQHPCMKFDLKISIIDMMRDRLHAYDR
jgi:hypothetical protein